MNELVSTNQSNVQTGLDNLALGDGQSNLTGNLLKNTELLSIILDMLGSNIAPDNPFAGIGSSLAKSSLASKAEAERVKESESVFDRILKSMNGVEERGPTTMSVSRDPSGAGYLYNVKGFEEGQKKMEETAGPTIRSSEEFIKDFGGGI